MSEVTGIGHSGIKIFFRIMYPNTFNQVKYLNSLSGLTQKLVIATIILLLYGYLCRLLGLYFFWESKSLGWTLFFITVIAVLRDGIKRKKALNKKAIGEKIGIGFCIFILLTKGIMFFATPHTNAYEKAISFIKTDQNIRREVGTVNGIFLIPFGGMGMTSNSQGDAGQADLHFVVKGSKKYIDLNLLMGKDFDTDWQIEIKR